MTKVKLNRLQPTYDLATADQKWIAGLIVDIRRGVKIEPILVCRNGKILEISDGHHRYEAARRAGLTRISCRIYDINE